MRMHHNFSNRLGTSIEQVVQLMIAVVLASMTILSAADKDWPQWRGPNSNGHAVERELPLKWNENSVVWKTPLDGQGQSSPVKAGERLFLTTALDEGRARVVLGVDIRDGRVVWKQVAWQGDPEKSHLMNGWASATCATDGKVVVAFFGKGGLHAYSMEGEHLWSKDLGTFESPWGTAACPVIFSDFVIQNCDSDRGAFIEAFERQTGQSVWRKTRPDHRGWSTPILIRRNGRDELVLNGHTGVTAYNPATGEELWFSKNSNGRGEPTVTPGAEALYVMCGLAGDMYSLKLSGTNLQPEIGWTAPRRGGRDLPSPIVVGNYVFVTNMAGIASMYDAQTGMELWKDRLEGKFSSSPIAIDGHILHQNESGVTYVIEPGTTANIVSKNKLVATPQVDEIFRASLVPVSGHVYSRSNKFLYCIGRK